MRFPPFKLRAMIPLLELLTGSPLLCILAPILPRILAWSLALRIRTRPPPAWVPGGIATSRAPELRTELSANFAQLEHKICTANVVMCCLIHCLCVSYVCLVFFFIFLCFFLCHHLCFLCQPTASLTPKAQYLCLFDSFLFFHCFIDRSSVIRQSICHSTDFLSFDKGSVSRHNCLRKKHKNYLKKKTEILAAKTTTKHKKNPWKAERRAWKAQAISTPKYRVCQVMCF